MDAKICKKGEMRIDGECISIEKKGIAHSHLWADFMNEIYYPAAEKQKKTMLNRMLTSYWQMHGKKLKIIEE